MFDITSKDAMLAASFNPYARSPVDAIGIASEAGATIVSITDSEDEIRKHAELSGIPFSQVTEVGRIIDPLTVNN